MSALYNNIDEFKFSCLPYSQKELNFLYLNARSLRNKFDEFEYLVDQFAEPDIVIVTESWIRNGEQDYFNLDRYTAKHLVRPELRGGGIAIYYKNSVLLSSIEEMAMPHMINVCEIKLKNKKFVLIVVYNHNIHNAGPFLDDLEIIIEKYKESDIVLVGDLNIDVNVQNPISLRYIEMVLTAGLEIKNTLPTRRQGNSSTVIDHIVMPIDLVCEPRTVLSDFSDHNLIVFSLPFVPHQPLFSPPNCRISYSKANQFLIRNPFSCPSSQVNECTEAFLKYLDDAKQYATYTTVSRASGTPHHAPWINDQYIELCKRKDILYTKTKKNSCS